MAKYTVGITWDYFPDKNNYLDWEDEYESEDEVEPRSEERLINLLRSEMEEAIFNGLNRHELGSMIEVLVVDEND